MNVIAYFKSAGLVVLLLVASTSARSQESVRVDPDIRELLVRMNGSHRSTKPLPVLFRLGDEKIADLIRALRDPDKNVRLSAQIVIRYLGNEQGMNAWKRMYDDQETDLTAPIPIPLNDADYDFIRDFYLKPGVLTE